MTRVTRRMLWWFVAAVALVVVFLIEERVRGVLSLRAWMRTMRAQGERLTIQDVAPELPTNPAVRIVSSFDAQTRMSGATVTGNAPSGMQIVAPGKALAVSGVDWWLDRDARTNRWSDLDDSLRALRPQLAELRSILTNRILFVNLDLEQGYDLMLPHLARVKVSMFALNAGTLHALRERRLDEAYEDLVAATFLLDFQKHEPLLISQLVRIACAGMAQGSVWEALQTDGWNDAQLATLQRRWEAQEFVAAAGRALEGERAMAALAYDPDRTSLRRLADITQGLPGLGLGGPQPDEGTRSDVEELFRPLIELGSRVRQRAHLYLWRLVWAEQDQLFHHRATQRLIETARRIARERRLEPEPAGERADPVFGVEPGRKDPSAYNRARHWLALATIPSFESRPSKAVRLEVVREQIVAAIALKRYQLRHGRLPASLEELVPEFLTQVPRDWYAAAPLRYRPADDGSFLLYSVGDNGVDDGGDSRNDRGELRGLHVGRDLVWPAKASPDEVAAAHREWLLKGRQPGAGR